MEAPIEIRKLSENDRHSVTSIFVEAFYNQLRKLDKDSSNLYKIFYNTFLIDHYIGAFIDNELVGFFALTDESERCLRINKKDVYNVIKGVKGYFAYKALKSEFEHKIILKESGYTIESVVTSKKYQGRGIATMLMNYAIENYEYLELDVLDINKRAYEIYKRVGFKVLKEKSVFPIFRRIVGYNKRIYM
ncbi:MAG: GNAT family N-acetyltransferase [Desulfosporosinus sp.]